MKTLADYKNEYKTAKTDKGKQSAYNRAMINLSYYQREEFYAWHFKTYVQPFNEPQAQTYVCFTSQIS